MFQSDSRLMLRVRKERPDWSVWHPPSLWVEATRPSREGGAAPLPHDRCRLDRQTDPRSGLMTLDAVIISCRPLGTKMQPRKPLRSKHEHPSRHSRHHSSMCRPRPTLSDRVSQGAQLQRSPSAPHHVLGTCRPDDPASRQRICCRPFITGAPPPKASAGNRTHRAS